MIVEKLKLIELLTQYALLKGQISGLQSQVALLTSQRDAALVQAAANESYRELIEDPEVQAAWANAVAASET